MRHFVESSDARRGRLSATTGHRLSPRDSCCTAGPTWLGPAWCLRVQCRGMATFTGRVRTGRGAARLSGIRLIVRLLVLLPRLAGRNLRLHLQQYRADQCWLRIPLRRNDLSAHPYVEGQEGDAGCGKACCWRDRRRFHPLRVSTAGRWWCESGCHPSVS